ncbi:MAG: hypothetical protein AAFO81_11955 [Pseudomonadota bacterium]
MNNVFARTWAGFVLLVWAVGGAQAQQMPETAQAWLDALSTAEVVEFTESDVKNLLSTTKALQAAGLDDLVDDNAPMDALAALEGNAEARSILKSNGYSPEKFSSHMMNIAMAMGAAEMQANKAEIDASIAQLQMLKDQIPPAQYEALYAQVVGVQEIFARAPAGNVELAEKYRTELEALGEE